MMMSNQLLWIQYHKVHTQELLFAILYQRQYENEEEKKFEVTVIYGSVNCDVINAEEDQCSPCSTALKAIKKAGKRKTRASEAPAKPKALMDLES